jgi:CRP-like cAMP-binding protein
MQQGQCSLTECFLCRNCLPEWKEVVAIHKKTQKVRKGQALFEEGSRMEGMYFLIEGAFKVHMHWGSKELILRFARAEDLLGHRGMSLSDTYPITATALQDSRVCFVPNPIWEATLKVNNKCTYELMRLYAGELRQAESRMRNLAHMDVKGRIAEALLVLKNVFGETDSGDLNINISRQDIASYAGTTYETVFKTFTEWTASGILLLSGKNIRIQQAAALEQLAREEER